MPAATTAAPPTCSGFPAPIAERGRLGFPWSARRDGADPYPQELVLPSLVYLRRFDPQLGRSERQRLDQRSCSAGSGKSPPGQSGDEAHRVILVARPRGPGRRPMGATRRISALARRRPNTLRCSYLNAANTDRQLSAVGAVPAAGGPAIGFTAAAAPSCNLCKEIRHVVGLDLTVPRMAPLRTTAATESWFGLVSRHARQTEETALAIVANEFDAALLGSRQQTVKKSDTLSM
jgi:hypothetical protein